MEHGIGARVVRCAKPSNAALRLKVLLASVRNAPFLTASLHAPYVKLSFKRRT